MSTHRKALFLSVQRGVAKLTLWMGQNETNDRKPEVVNKGDEGVEFNLKTLPLFLFSSV